MQRHGKTIHHHSLVHIEVVPEAQAVKRHQRKAKAKAKAASLCNQCRQLRFKVKLIRVDETSEIAQHELKLTGRRGCYEPECTRENVTPDNFPPRRGSVDA